MPTSTPASIGTPAQRLTCLFAALGEADRHALLAFAEFLAAGRPPLGARAPTQCPGPRVDPLAPRPDDPHQDAPPQHPTPVPRPAQETVIAAIRRLGLTYPMLDRGPMLHETSALMSAHVLHGRAAAPVIDDLEALFRRRYQDYCERAPGAADTAASGPPAGV